MTIQAGKTQGGNALLSATPNNPNQGSRPIGWNLMEPDNVPVVVGSDNVLRKPDGLPVGGGVGPTLGLVGDSITAQWLNSADPSNVYTQGRGYILWALRLSGCFVNVLTAATPSTGMTSKRLANLPTFQTQRDTLLAARVDYAHMMGGVNDIQSDATLAELIEAATELMDSLTPAVKRLYVGTIPPVDSTQGNYSTARQSVLLAYNDWIRRKCAVSGGKFRLVDYYRAVVDPASPTSSMLAAASADGLHPVNYGAYLMGKALAAAWAEDGIPALQLRLASAGDARVDHTGATLFSGSTNILQNGLFNLGSPSSGVAATWTVVDQGTAGGSSVRSVVAAPSGIGSAQKLECTFTATGQQTKLTSASFASRLALPGSLLVTLRIDVAPGPVNLKGVRVRINGFGNVNAVYNWDQLDASDIALTEGFTDNVAFLMNLPAGLTTPSSFVLDVFAESAGAGSATITVSEASVRAIAA